MERDTLPEVIETARLRLRPWEVIDEAWYGILRDEWLERTEGLATPPPNGS